jgi:hypothetical protein
MRRSILAELAESMADLWLREEKIVAASGENHSGSRRHPASAGPIEIAQLRDRPTSRSPAHPTDKFPIAYANDSH